MEPIAWLAGAALVWVGVGVGGKRAARIRNRGEAGTGLAHPPGPEAFVLRSSPTPGGATARPGIAQGRHAVGAPTSMHTAHVQDQVLPAAVE